MIKISTLTTIIVIFSLLFSSCKKELPVETKKFGILNLSNQTTFQNLSIEFNDVPLNKTDGLDFNLIKVPEGRGKLSFKDDDGNSFLDTLYNSEPNITRNWVLFQPSADLKPVVLENTGADVAQPDNDHIKIKFANFIPKAFTKPVDVIFYWSDPDTFELVEGGRLNHIGQSFQKDFSEILYKDKNTNNIVIMIVDSDTQQPLLDDIYAVFEALNNKRILTCYFVEDQFGSTVTGTPYKILVKTLFAN